jgi:serine protease
VGGAALGTAGASAQQEQSQGRGAPAKRVPAEAPTSLTGRLLVSLRAPTRGRAHAAAVDAVLARSGARPDGASVPQLGMLTVRPAAGTSLRRLMLKLRAEPGVRAVTPERRFTARGVVIALTNDPAMNLLEGAQGTPANTPLEWWALRENLPEAWGITQGAGAKVAVIDSGIDASNPEFAGRIDYFADFDSEPGEGSALTDQTGHGTHVAGLACATANNGIGIAGAGYDCQLLVEKSDLTESSVIRSIVDATDHGAQAINMSFGTTGAVPAPPQLYEAVRYAYRHNVVMVAAAADVPVTEQGDPANVLQPAGSGPELTAGMGLDVTSANFESQRSAFAGFGSEISMAAYGSFYDNAAQGGPPGLLSTFPGNTTAIERGTLEPFAPPCGCRVSLGGDDRYAYLEGTSMAAPQVAAVGALIRQLNPGLSAAQIIQLLKQTAQRPTGAGWTAGLGWGILNAGAAVTAASEMDTLPPVSRLIGVPRSTRHSEITLRWTGSDPALPGIRAPGIALYEVYRSIDHGRAVKIAMLPAGVTTLRVHLKPGRVYGWYTVAIDNNGLREGAKALSRAHSTVARAGPRRTRARVGAEHG